MIQIDSTFTLEDRQIEKLKDKAKVVLMKAMFKMEELAIKKAPVFEGELRQKIKLTPKKLSDEYTLISGAGHSADLEFGNRPTFAPMEDLINWVEKKGIKSGDEVYSFAKYVQKKIKEKGVNAQPYMRPSLIEVKNFWLPLFIREFNEKN